MKPIIILLVSFLIFNGCTEKKKTDSLALANEVCDCKMKTKGMKYNDPERMKIWRSCIDLQGINYKKLMGEKDAVISFNTRIKECYKEFTIGTK